jgi:hypothetical protein
MQRKTLAICLIVVTIVLIGACKKNGPNVPTNPNVPHALSDSFYYRALFDTTWRYYGDANKGECHSNNGLCASFLYGGTFTLNDSANPHPHDSIIRSWVGKTFITPQDTASSHQYTFSFSYQDSMGHKVGTEFPVNSGASMTINSVVSDGVSILTLDTAGHGYKLYKLKGTFNANMSHYQDTTMYKVTQGVFSINVMESILP